MKKKCFDPTHVLKLTLSLLLLTFALLCTLPGEAAAQQGATYVLNPATGEVIVEESPDGKTTTRLIPGAPAPLSPVRDPSPKPWGSTITGRNLGGVDLIPNDGDVLSGTFTGIGLFWIQPGFTVFVDPGVSLSIEADMILIDGTLEGTGAGFAGGGR